MNREKLFQHLEQHYVSKREMISRIPLGVQPDEIWQDILNRRRASGTILSLHSSRGTPYWYVTTQKMATASDRIITEMMENETDFDPYRNLPTTTSLEESFFTSYVEGSQLTMQDAMAFIQGDMEPESAEEQLILNNRNALNFICSNLYRPVSEEFIKTIAGFLNENMEIGGAGYRGSDYADIPSMKGLPYEVISSFMIPNSVQEICFLIADPTIHPLIKAAVSQAWALVVRPYPDGNERLGRLLSQFILLRSGYHFFSEVSISSLIARKSYAYFNAMKNILLPENGGDMTYFLEYFMTLLVDAVNERHLRLEASDTESIDTEQQMAKQPLIAVSPPAPSPPSPSPTPLSSDGSDTRIDSRTNEKTGESDKIKGGDYSNVTEKLIKLSCSNGKHIANCARLLLEWIDQGRYIFSTEDLATGLHIGIDTAGNKITTLREKGIVSTHSRGKTYASYEFVRDEAPPIVTKSLSNEPRSITWKVLETILHFQNDGKYEFTVVDIAEVLNMENKKVKNIVQNLRARNVIKSLEKKIGVLQRYSLTSNSTINNTSSNEYTPEVLEAIEKLATYPYSPRDRRIGEALKGSLSTGIVKKDGYDEKRWAADMRLAEQIGLVEQIDPDTYRILPDIRQPELSPVQKKTITVMYENFGEEVFSQDMFMATLEYSDSHASAVLHELTLIRVLDCWREDSNRYRLNVNPETKPEYFEVA